MRDKIRAVMRFSGPRMIFRHPIMAIGHVIEDRREKKEWRRKAVKGKKIFWITLGFIGVGLGALGAALPLLPAFPFLMLALFSFGKSSERLHKWFIGTKLYKNNLESFVKGQGMTRRTKIKLMITVTLLMSVGFVMMWLKGLYIPCAILGGVWLFHIIYFAFGVKRYRAKKSTVLTE